MALRAILWVAVSTKTQATDERESLPAQERDLRALAEKHGWRISDVLIVPGHSRRYIDIHECARDMATEGIQAFNRLLAHWDAQDFDILAVRDSSRFGRTQSLHAYVVERTIAIGAKIHSLIDGEINESNFRMFIAMGGYASAGEIDKLQKQREVGYNARAARGLPVNSVVVQSHKLIRDERSGKAAKVVVNEARRQEWLDLVEVVCGNKELNLQPTPWRLVELVMFERFGYANPLGEPHSVKHYYRILSTPSFYGHVARYFKMSKRGAWVREPGHEVPPGVLIQYGINLPAVTGTALERLEAEMTRREGIRGKMKPASTHKFSGLLICHSCKYTLSGAHEPEKQYYAWRCSTKYMRLLRDCTENKMINQKRVQAWLDERLQQWLGSGAALDTLLQPAPEAQDAAQRLEKTRKDMTALERQIQNMIVKQATADDSLRDSYDRALAEAGKRMERLKSVLKGLEQKRGADVSLAQQHSWDEFKQIGMERFWKLPDVEINQWLFRLLGKWRLAVSNGQIVGLETPPKSTKRYDGFWT